MSTSTEVQAILKKHGVGEEDCDTLDAFYSKKRDWLDYVGLGLHLVTATILAVVTFKFWRSSKK